MLVVLIRARVFPLKNAAAYRTDVTPDPLATSCSMLSAPAKQASTRKQALTIVPPTRCTPRTLPRGQYKKYYVDTAAQHMVRHLAAWKKKISPSSYSAGSSSSSAAGSGAAAAGAAGAAAPPALRAAISASLAASCTNTC